METDEKKVVSIMSFNSVMEAQLYKALLESAGVTARLQNDIATQIYPPIGMLLPVNILVAEEDQVRAREILGAKFDLDDFQRQSNPNKDKNKKTPAHKPTAKADVKKPEANKSSAQETECDVMIDAPKEKKAEPAEEKATASKRSTVKKTVAKK